MCRTKGSKNKVKKTNSCVAQAVSQKSSTKYVSVFELINEDKEELFENYNIYRVQVNNKNIDYPASNVIKNFGKAYVEPIGSEVDAYQFKKYLVENCTGVTNLKDKFVNYLLGKDDVALLGTSLFVKVNKSYDFNICVNKAIDYFKDIETKRVKAELEKAKQKVAQKKEELSLLVYKNGKHRVPLSLCETFVRTYIDQPIYTMTGKNILLVGQWDNIFINRFAHSNNVYIWTDDGDNYIKSITLDTDFIKHYNNVHITKDFKELMKMCAGKSFDLVISNPPYGKIGADITWNIIKTIKPAEFVNLMPQNDYTRVENLIKYVDLDTLERVDNLFEDAEVIPWIAKINNYESEQNTKEAFELTTYEKSLRKFYKENMNREHYAIDTYLTGTKKRPNDDFSTVCDFMITHRTNDDGVHKTTECNDYKWNVEESTSLKDAPISNGVYQCGWVRFKSTIEKKNFADFWYNGKLMNKLIKGRNRKSGTVKPALPKVDWTRPWTDEEILKEFGYTDTEIKKVLR